MNSMAKPRDHQTPFLDVLILDMDGVLIDVSDSYRKTIQKTVHLYLTTLLGLKIDPQKVSLDKAISLFKSAGGFNNDWDLTSGLLIYLLSTSNLPPFPKPVKFSTISEVVDHLRAKAKGSHARRTLRVNLRHLSSFLGKVKTSGGGLKSVRKHLRNSWDGWVYRSGGLDRENVIKRIFQEVYLGEMFIPFYRLRPLFYSGRGYYLREKMLIPRLVLSRLQKKLRLGIASGRPRYEAELALKRFRLFSYFDSVVTLDDCLEEEDRILRVTGKRVRCSKPHPYPLLRAIHEIGLSHPQCGYVGDVVDDMRAARAVRTKASVLAIGFISDEKDRATEKALVQAGADRVMRHPKDLLGLLAQGENPLLLKN
jgi:HAD superfamily phosphatase